MEVFLIILLFFNISINSAFSNRLQKEVVVSSHVISLEKRYENKFVNDVFKNNILLNLAYMDEKVKKPEDIDWNTITKPFRYQFKLNPNETFAYHEDVFKKYENKIVKTTNSNFNFNDGYKSDGYLVGDGVCHLASLIYWVAKDAKLGTEAPTNHDFAPIPQVPKEYGVSIYRYPGKSTENAIQNLYITNNTQKAVEFIFDFDGTNLKISAVSEKTKILKS